MCGEVVPDGLLLCKLSLETLSSSSKFKVLPELGMLG